MSPIQASNPLQVKYADGELEKLGVNIIFILHYMFFFFPDDASISFHLILSSYSFLSFHLYTDFVLMIYLSSVYVDSLLLNENVRAQTLCRYASKKCY